MFICMIEIFGIWKSIVICLGLGNLCGVVLEWDFNFLVFKFECMFL